MDCSFVSFKDMDIPSRKELHFKRKEESNSSSSTNTNLYCEDDSLNEPTDFEVKHGNSKMFPHEE